MEVVERVLQILQHGSTASTYKYAVLLALIDVCVERADVHGMPPTSVTTRQLAERVVELYWAQTRTWPDSARTMLQQNTQRGRSIPHMVCELRARLEVHHGRSVPTSHARFLDAAGWEELAREVEWRLIEMPLPKLQRIDREVHSWLYAITWDDEFRAPKKAEVKAYQEGKPSTFDNQVRLVEGVASVLVRMHTLLRPFVQQQWVQAVAKLNALPENRLHEFLFGSERVALEPVRTPLSRLQRGLCFYCKQPLGRRVHVDHFLPWARFGEDGLANLVVADETCNGDKSDQLPAHELVRRWHARNRGLGSEIAKVAPTLQWEIGAERTLGLARATYLHLPGGLLLWGGRKQLVPYDRDEVLRALA